MLSALWSAPGDCAGTGAALGEMKARLGPKGPS
jgi:hypothetical protein